MDDTENLVLCPLFHCQTYHKGDLLIGCRWIRFIQIVEHKIGQIVERFEHGL